MRESERERACARARSTPGLVLLLLLLAALRLSSLSWCCHRSLARPLVARYFCLCPQSDFDFYRARAITLGAEHLSPSLKDKNKQHIKQQQPTSLSREAEWTEAAAAAEPPQKCGHGEPRSRRWAEEHGTGALLFLGGGKSSLRCRHGGGGRASGERCPRRQGLGPAAAAAALRAHRDRQHRAGLRADAALPAVGE